MAQWPSRADGELVAGVRPVVHRRRAATTPDLHVALGGIK
jgi:hypothetical protein